jgi:outer membrane protein OmpA-like peptidoglycan-associated protein
MRQRLSISVKECVACDYLRDRGVIVLTFASLVLTFCLMGTQNLPNIFNYEEIAAMRLHIVTTVASAVGFTLMTGCATSGALRRSNEQNAAALTAERQARMTSDSTNRAEMEATLQRELGTVKGDITQLRSQLEAMRTDFGAKIAMMEDGLHFAMPVNFAFNDATVRSQDEPTLTRFATVVQKYYPQSKITIEGFADPKGGTRFNQTLSQKRANSVKDYLAGHGLSTQQLATVGYGETRLVTPGASGDQPGAELNRRVVFVVETSGTNTVALATPNELQQR